MGHELDDEQRQKLGLRSSQLSKPDVIDVSTGVDRMLQAEDLEERHTAKGDEEFIQHVRNLDWGPPRESERLNRADLTVRVDKRQPHLVNFHADDADELRIHSVPGERKEQRMTGVFDDPDDSSLIYVDFDAAQAVLLDTGEAQLVVTVRDESLVVWEVHDGREQSVRQPVSFDPPPVEDWVDEDDTWMADYVEQALQADDPWRWFAAAGTWGRLRRQSEESRVDAVEALMAGEQEPGAAKTDEWAHSLTPEQRHRLKEMFVSRIDLLGESLDRLNQSLDPNSSGWIARYRRLLHGRDDIDSVRWTLAETNALEQTEATLEGLDERGRRLVATLPSIDELQDDERLVRAAGLNPEAWWVYPAIDQREDVRRSPSHGAMPEDVRRNISDNFDEE